MLTVFSLFQHLYPLSDHLSIRCHRSFILSRPVTLAAQDLYSPSKQITAVAHANSKVISTPVVLPTLSDRPQPATTNTHVRSHARRPTVEISLSVVFIPKANAPGFHPVLLYFSTHAFIQIYTSTSNVVLSPMCIIYM